jgi:hypothetical protein
VLVDLIVTGFVSSCDRLFWRLTCLASCYGAYAAVETYTFKEALR